MKSMAKPRPTWKTPLPDEHTCCSWVVPCVARCPRCPFYSGPRHPAISVPSNHLAAVRCAGPAWLQACNGAPVRFLLQLIPCAAVPAGCGLAVRTLCTVGASTACPTLSGQARRHSSVSIAVLMPAGRAWHTRQGRCPGPTPAPAWRCQLRRRPHKLGCADE